jgi:hypothetical protein
MERLPNAKSAPTPDRREEVQRTVARRSLAGLANDTKWDEFITGMRATFPAGSGGGVRVIVSSASTVRPRTGTSSGPIICLSR